MMTWTLFLTCLIAYNVKCYIPPKQRISFGGIFKFLCNEVLRLGVATIMQNTQFIYAHSIAYEGFFETSYRLQYSIKYLDNKMSIN